MSTSTTAPVTTKWWSGGKSPFNVEYGKLMMWYFLMSDAFTFGAFLIAYGTTRFATAGWPNPNEVFKSYPSLHATQLVIKQELQLLQLQVLSF